MKTDFRLSDVPTYLFNFSIPIPLAILHYDILLEQ